MEINIKNKKENKLQLYTYVNCFCKKVNKFENKNFVIPIVCLC